MTLLNRPYASTYEELIAYYPRFYRDVFEMDAILRAECRFLDDFEDNVERGYKNSFIDTADEETIADYEDFLGIQLNKVRTLEERRGLVKSYFVGFGKISASVLEEMITAYTGAPVDIFFEPFDEAGNNKLYINFDRGEQQHIWMSDILTLLRKKIPAHIEYRPAVTYRFPVVIEAHRLPYPVEFDYAGTKPDIVLLGEYLSTASVTRRDSTNAVISHHSADDEEEAGTYPLNTTLGHTGRASSIVMASGESITTTHPNPAAEAAEAGLEPAGILFGALNQIDAEAGVTVSDCGVDYINCGEEYATE